MSLQILQENLFKAFSEIQQVLTNANTLKQEQTTNKFGDLQLSCDITTEKIIVEALKKSDVAYFLSEETPELTELDAKKQYIVTFDPLDGSSIIGTNFTVGTIVGVWKNDDSKLIGKKCKDQITAYACLYGPRMTVVTFNVEKLKVEEFTYSQNQFVLTREDIKVNKEGKLFAPGNLRASNGSEQYKRVINYWIENNYTLRYTGGMVPDIYQIFVKGYGIFSNIGTQQNPVKLRVLYEIAPLSFLIHKADGDSYDGQQDLMNLQITGYDQRHSIVVGTVQEINIFKEKWNQ